jgi:hypothetical protein
MKKAALWALVPLCTLLILACPNPASNGGGGGGGDATTITSEGSLAAPVVLDYWSFRECQIDADSPSWYQFTIPEDYDIRIKINGMNPALGDGEFIDVFLSDDKNTLPSAPTFVVTNANMNSFVSFNNLEAGTWFLMVDSPYKSVRFNITMTASIPDDGGDDDDPTDENSEGIEANPIALTLGKYRMGTVGSSAPSYYSLNVPIDSVSYFIKLFDISPAPSTGGYQVYMDVGFSETESGNYEELALLDFPEDNDHQVFYFPKAGTLTIKVSEDHPCTFKLVVSIHNYSDLTKYPPESEGMGTEADPWTLQLNSPRTLGSAGFGGYRYLSFDAAEDGADYTLRFEPLDDEGGSSGRIFSDSNSLEYYFNLDESPTEMSFSAIGPDTFVELPNYGSIRVTLSEAETEGRWEALGDKGFSVGKVIAKKLTYNPTTGELWAVCHENRGTTAPDIVLAVYRAGANNNSWTEVTGLPAMNSPANPAIAVDSQGTVYVAFNQIYTDHATYSHRWAALIQYNGSSWSTVGAPEDIQYGTDPQNITLLVDGDDVLHALWSSGEGQGFELKYFTWDGADLDEEGFDEDIDGYNFAAVLNSLGNVTLGVSWYTPFYHWESGTYTSATGNFIETSGGSDDHTSDRGTVWMAAASDGTPWAILRDTIDVDQHQYRLWRLTESGWESVHDFPAYFDYSEVEYIEGLAIAGSAPAILSSRDWATSVWGYEAGSTELVLLGERWLAYDTLREGELFAGKYGELFVIGITNTNDTDPADGKLSVYTWEQ